MGEIADQIINGECCQFCLEPFDEPTGYPVSCACCEEPVKRKPPAPRKGETNCPTCGKRVRKAGLNHHIRVVHNT